MVLAVDIGSTVIFGGLLKEGRLLADFRKSTASALTEDELGLFFLSWLAANGKSRDDVDDAVFCSVVPELNAVMNGCIRKYFGIQALSLKAGVKSGLKLRYSNPRELGADLIANAVAASKLYPDENLIIVDFGTATSLCAVSSAGEYLGGTLIPGLAVAMEALSTRTAGLPVVEIQPVEKVCARDVSGGIQSGLYYGTLGMLKELTGRMEDECFSSEGCRIISTGMYADLYSGFGLFDKNVPELVLLGLEQIHLYNLN